MAYIHLVYRVSGHLNSISNFNLHFPTNIQTDTRVLTMLEQPLL